MSNPKKLIRKAKALMNSGDYSSALEVYKTILRSYPKNKEAKQGLTDLSRAHKESTSNFEDENENSSHFGEMSSSIFNSNLKMELEIEEYECLVAYYQARNFSGLSGYISGLLKKYPRTDKLYILAATIQYGLNNFPAAIQDFRRSLILDPHSFDAHLGIARSFASLNDFNQAKYHLELALKIEPDSLIAIQYLVATVANLGSFEEAVKISRYGLKRHPKSEDLFIQLAKLFQARYDFSSSLEVLEQALCSIGQTEKLLRILIITLIKLERVNEAFYYLDLVLEINPQLTNFCSMRAGLSNYIPRITSEEQLEIARAYEKSLGIKTEEIYTSWHCEFKPDPIRIGFVSGDFYDQVVGRMLLKVLSFIDRSKFELLAFSTSKKEDQVSKKLKKEFSNWTDISSDVNFQKSAERIYSQAPNILIDLSGHMENNALPVFAYKPAPLQISWLGYFSTTGINMIDYKLVDHTVVPNSMEKHFVEQIYRLPNCFLCPSNTDEYDSLINCNYKDKNEIIFGSVNRFNKINDGIIECWSEILNSVTKSRMILKGRGGSEGKVGDRIREQFKKHGTDVDRLIFTDRSSLKDYYRTLVDIDIVLDTFPFTGGVTTADALWMGTPVIGRKGIDTLVSYQGESILRNSNMEKFIAEDESNYIEKAIAVASDIRKSNITRFEILNSVRSSPLFDTSQFAKDLEKALLDMWDQKTMKNAG